MRPSPTGPAIFEPSRWLRWPHGQTAWSPLFRSQTPPEARQVYWPTPDGDRLSVWLRQESDSAPWVLLLHGLEGCSRSNYIVGLRSAFAALGWNVAALEFRSCDGMLNSAPRLYHSGETTDLALVVSELQSRLGARELYLVGFSLGGNVVAKWLGECGDGVGEIVIAAALVSPPFDLTVSGPAIDRALSGLYVRRFLRTLIPKGLAKARQFPGLLDEPKIAASRTFEEFDTWATAALHGFDDAWDYWEKVGCGQFLAAVRVPTLIVAAEDDPFNPASSLPREICNDSPWLHPRFSARGGHVGFVYGAPWGTRHWAEEQVFAFFERMRTLSGTTGNS
ncbi:MAG: alpha/beta fold hydrolase [Acidobacteriota bacterium]|nr:alpha/beta fold hydrolase [Acidobacteriota bacterium]